MPLPPYVVVVKPLAFGLILSASIFNLLLTTHTFGQRNLRDIPDPNPANELKSFIVADGFEVNLFAADPMLAKPIQMNFDDQGRLWIASSEVYPHIEPGQVANDKVLVLEDRDRDGVADQTTVFADGLLIPTGVLPGDGGCYVVNSTELLHFTDSDGDGIADGRRIVLSGFGTEDTHHLLHTLRWGPDGRLYMNQSIYIHSHVETPYGVRHLNGGGIWRYDPWTQQLAILCRGFVNPWGHHFDQWGQSFATDGAYGEGINYVFPGAVFVTAVGATRTLGGLNPGSPKHCGLEIVGGSHLPDEWQGNMLTNDFRANRVCRFVVTENGAGYASQQMSEVLKTSNVAFRPIDVKVGPDGAIYIADWYNPIIQHGEVDFRDPRRDHTHGRIWRVTAKDRPISDWPDLAGASISELLDYLKSPEPPVRLHAKLNLKRFPPADVARALEGWVGQFDSLRPEDIPMLLEALWAYQNIHISNVELLKQLLVCPVGQARAAAVRVLVDWQSSIHEPEDLLARAIRDEHPRVRLEAVRGLSSFPKPQSATIATRVLVQPMDRFLDFALWQTLRDLEPYWLPAYADGEPMFDDEPMHAIYALEAVDSPATVGPVLALIRQASAENSMLSRCLTILAKHGDADDLRVVYDHAMQHLDSSNVAQGVTLLDALQRSCRERSGLAPSGSLATFLSLKSHPSADVQAVLCRGIGTWRIGDGLSVLRDLARSEEIDWRVRQSAISALADFDKDTAVRELSAVIQSSLSRQARRHAIAVFARVDLGSACDAAVVELGDDRDAVWQDELWQAILSQQGGSEALAGRLANSKLSDTTAKILLRTAQSLGMAEPFLSTVREAGSLDDATWVLTSELSERLIRQIEQHGNPRQGESIYRLRELQCQNCHAIAGSGGDVGPDLASIGASAPVDYLIEALLAPNAKIKENFHTKTLVTLDGRVVNGIPISQSGGVLTMKLADGSRFTIREKDVEEIADGKSLMADGLVDQLTEDELVDLITFLSQLGRIGDYSVDNRLIVRDWQSLTWTEAAHQRLNRTGFDSVAAKDESSFSWKNEYARVSGELPLHTLDEFQPQANSNPTVFVRFELNVDQPGTSTIKLNQRTGIRVWHNDTPKKLDQLDPLKLAQGRHRFTLAIDRRVAPKDTIEVELLPQRSSGIQLRLDSTESQSQ